MNYSDYQGSSYVGMDLGDRKSHISFLRTSTGELNEEVIATTGSGMTSFFSDLPKSLVAIEVGTHSFWISNLIESFGHTVVIANPRQVFLISKSHRKVNLRWSHFPQSPQEVPAGHSDEFVGISASWR